ncbi:g3278 [Coccomyxa elongata]
MARMLLGVLSAVAVLALCRQAHAQNAGPWNENSLVGVPSEVKTGEQYGAGQKVNVCKFTLGSVNPWDLKPEIQYLPVTAELFLSTAGRGSFIAPAVGFLHYGPSCYLYDHVCNFNYQEPCNLRGTCQTNNTCFCTNGFKTCRPLDGTLTSASAGCETDIYTDANNCGDCGVVCPTGQICDGGACFNPNTVPSPPPPAGTTPPPPPPPAAAVNGLNNAGVEPASTESVPSSGATGGGTGVVTSSSEAAKKAKNAAAKAAAAKKAAQSSAAGQVNPAATIATAGRRLLEVPSL